MGNRAVITTDKEWKQGGIGVYLHWNGGRDSVQGFLKYCELKGYRAPDVDSYGFARLCQVIGNFFGGGLSVGVDRLWFLDKDNGDNGVYIIEGWEIKDRIYPPSVEQTNYDLASMLAAIDERMPVDEQFGEEYWQAEVVSVGELAIGDEVFIMDKCKGTVSKEKVVGVGDDIVVNGRNVQGIPFICKYAVNNPAGNINNYLQDKEYRKKVRGQEDE